MFIYISARKQANSKLNLNALTIISHIMSRQKEKIRRVKLMLASLRAAGKDTDHTGASQNTGETHKLSTEAGRDQAV